jgi:Protein of unknown function (DUF3592)
MKGRLFLSLFALPFFGVGVWMLWSVSSTFHDAWQMQSWVPVEARLGKAGYETHSGDDSDTYEAYAQYSYDYLGRSYHGHRVSLGSGADNIGDYQQDMGRRLQRASERGAPITVYVDPQRPSHSIIDRSLRWGLLGFKSIFVVVFGGVGLGLLIAAWRAPKEKDTSAPQYADRPWLLNDDWQTATIRSGSRASMWGAWIFAALWNAISAPIPFLAWREIVERHNYLVFIALLFPLVGIGLLIWAIRRTLEWRRFGAAPVTLDPFPGSIGGHVGGTIDLNLPLDPAAKFRVTLTNIHSYETGSGDNRSRSEKAKWQDAVVAHAEPGGRGTRLSFRFDVPEGLHVSDTERDDSYYLWRLDLKADMPGTDLDRSYEIPVFATGQLSRLLPERDIESARAEQDAIDAQAVRDLVNLSYGAMGKRMLFPMGRYLGSSLIGMLVGGVFAAAGWFLITSEGLTVFGSIFGGMGALVALSCVYVPGNSLEVAQAGNTITSTRRFLGIPLGRRQMRGDEIVQLQKSTNMQARSGGTHVIYYKVHALDRAGNRMIVGEGFRGDNEADAAVELISREFGLRLMPDRHAAGHETGLLGREALS